MWSDCSWMVLLVPLAAILVLPAILLVRQKDHDVSVIFGKMMKIVIKFRKRFFIFKFIRCLLHRYVSKVQN